MRVFLLALIGVLGLCAPARAAQIPSAEERAALEALLRDAVADTCEDADKRSRPLPLVTDDRTWGTATTRCQWGTVPSGAGTYVATVFAHRSSATSGDWTVVRPTSASRLPPCLGEDGLFTTVPEPVVRELRALCVNPSASRGHEPMPVRMLRVFRNRLHEFDDLGPSVTLNALSDITRRANGYFAITHEGPATVAHLREAFGGPRRDGCRLRWARVDVEATACRGRLTKLVLGAAWRLTGDTEPAEDVSRAEVEVGDPVELARYLDARLAKLVPDGRLRLPRMRIGRDLVTVKVRTQAGRITAFEVARAPGPR